MKQAEDFRQVSAEVERLLEPLAEADYQRETGFKTWTVNQILRHLHVWNKAAYLSLTDETALKTFLGEVMGAVTELRLPDFEASYLDGASGRHLFEIWRTFFPVLADAFSEADPAARLAWAGPSMSARSSITARLMETWAHAQAIYDEFGMDRENTDAIENIVVLGVNTYAWTFANRKLPVPDPRPRVRLTAPSGAVWEFGEGNGEEQIEGEAEAFCQVVTQTRNIQDTALQVTGANAAQWMRYAQCFAGPPVDPPAPGARRKKTGGQ